MVIREYIVLPSPRKRPCILHVTSSAQIGGTERMLIRFLGRCNRDRFQHHVVAMQPEGPLLDAVAERLRRDAARGFFTAHLLVDVEHVMHGPVANGVNRRGQPGGAGAARGAGLRSARRRAAVPALRRLLDGLVARGDLHAARQALGRAERAGARALLRDRRVPRPRGPRPRGAARADGGE